MVSGIQSPGQSQAQTGGARAQHKCQREKGRREPRAAAYFFSILESLDGLADAVGRVEAKRSEEAGCEPENGKARSEANDILHPQGIPCCAASRENWRRAGAAAR